ncbi:SGNH/GDSL hydrolase family protein [Microbacterium schleiferi]|uniref:SGNH/GDSL hydrolase family protein n=1 Tax=Microbacterium schleiferi TaxID=69362 RepID=A0ABU7V4G7_9MICO
MLTLVTAVGVVLALQPPSPPQPRAELEVETPPQMIPPTVVFIGDSYTGGSDMGGRGDRNWTSIVASEKRWNACTLGIGGSGWTRGSNGWTFGARVEWAASLRPSLIVFANGVNDLKDPAGVEAGASEALASVRRHLPDVPIVIVGPARVNPSQSPAIDRMDSQLRAVAGTFGARYISPTGEGWLDGGNSIYLGTDGFHPTDEGHVYLARRFIDAFDEFSIELSDVAKKEARACIIPPWQHTYPNGGQVIQSPTPLPTG